MVTTSYRGVGYLIHHDLMVMVEIEQALPPRQTRYIFKDYSKSSKRISWTSTAIWFEPITIHHCLQNFHENSHSFNKNLLPSQTLLPLLKNGMDFSRWIPVPLSILR